MREAEWKPNYMQEVGRTTGDVWMDQPFIVRALLNPPKKWRYQFITQTSHTRVTRAFVGPWSVVDQQPEVIQI